MSNAGDDNPFLLAIANTRRMEILRELSKQEMSVGKLADTVHLSQSALSQHLSRLRAVNFVTSRREGQSILYRCDSEHVTALLDALDKVTNALGPSVELAAATHRLLEK